MTGGPALYVVIPRTPIHIFDNPQDWNLYYNRRVPLYGNTAARAEFDRDSERILRIIDMRNQLAVHLL